MPVEIDGSIGEGGGQVFRNSISYAAITNQSLKITNIRANRSPSGLKPQHLTALRLVRDITNAEVQGDYKGSKEVTFIPHEIQGGDYTADTGTAGSITLILQAFLPLTLFARAPIKVELRGGTDVKWSPPIDSFRFVFLPFLRDLGVSCDVNLIRRGHYPRGGGIVKVQLHPLITPLSPIHLEERGSIKSIQGRSHCVSLPKHVAERQAKAARAKLNNHGYKNVSIEVEWYKKREDPHKGPGSGIVLWAEGPQRMLLEADSLGARGKPAEKVGREAATRLVEQIRRGGRVDVHHTDQLIPFLAMANGTSVIHSAKISSHTLTAITIAEKFFNVDFIVKGKEGEEGLISVEGASLP